MAIELTPLPLPASADPSKFKEFGREVKGVNPGNLSAEQFNDVQDALYKVRKAMGTGPCRVRRSHVITSMISCCSET
jgi:hypothetical protein